MANSPSPPPAVLTAYQGGDNIANCTNLSAIHQDIIQTHILTRLDGPSLAAVASVSTQLRDLSAEESLWREICTATWPSVKHPRVQKFISSFPSGHRSLFSGSFPFLDYPDKKIKSGSDPENSELISAIDIYFKNDVVLSKVQEIETATGWFLCSPFRVDILDPKESVRTPIQCRGPEAAWLRNLEENLSLSWILIDPNRKRSGNFSTRKPVSVERHWLTREIQVKFSVILGAVECGVIVTCGGEEGKGMHVREVSMQMMDMEGKGMSGAESVAILAAAMEGGRRRVKGNEGRDEFGEFVERKRGMKEKKQRAERALDLGCMMIGAIGLMTFWWAALLRR